MGPWHLLRLPPNSARKEGCPVIFKKDIEPRCAYCAHGNSLGEDQIICVKKGVVSPAGSCRRFKYDPLKRVPPKPLVVSFDKFSDEDFSI